ncbi:MAG: hypothetical protein AAGH68_04350 [Pseudomonadota bacterium]
MTCGLYYNSIMGAVSPALAGGDVDTAGLRSPSVVEMCQNIGAGLLQDQFKIQAHKRILCELMCCCNSRALPGASPGIADQGETLADPKRQACVEDAIGSHLPMPGSGVDNPMHRAEVTYNMQFRDPVPLMDYPAGAAMEGRGRLPDVLLYDSSHLHYHRDYGRIIGRTNREFDPLVRTQRDLGRLPRFRRPDVVVTRSPLRPLPYAYPGEMLGTRILGDNSNILSVFEMKFPGDRERPGQFADYRTIAGTGHFEVLTTGKESCNCRDQSRQQAGQPATAPYSQPAGETNLLPDPTQSPSPSPAPESSPGGSPQPGNDEPPIIPPVPLPGPRPKGPRCIRFRGVPICL